LDKSVADPNLYYLREGLLLVILMIYVDDLYMTGNSSSKLHEIKHKIMHQYEMTDLSSIQRYLGVKFSTLPKGILLHQQSFLTKILKDFDM
jgi:hypothetical protein